MKIERSIIIIALLFFSTLVFSQRAMAPQKSRLVLEDGTELDGYLRSIPTNVDTLIMFSEKSRGKQKSYGVSRIKYLDVQDGNLLGLWFPLRINNEIGEVGQVWRDQGFLQLIYKGKNVNGYLGFDYWHGWRCYYKPFNQWYAKAFCPFKKINKHRKQLLLQEFDKYPKLTKMIETGEISDKDISENPFVLLKELDELLISN